MLLNRVGLAEELRPNRVAGGFPFRTASMHGIHIMNPWSIFKVHISALFFYERQ